MKKLLLCSVCIVFVLYSCSKSNKIDIGPKTGISATIDGADQNFNSLDSIRAVGTSGIYFSGGKGTADTSDRIAFYVLNSSTPVAPGTYSSLDPNPAIQIFYEKGGPRTNDYFFNYGSAFSITITVTSVTATNIQGTFSGKLILESMIFDETPKTVTITNGKFNVTAP